MKNILKFILIIIGVPFMVLLISHVGILLSVEFYWGNEVLEGSTGFKVRFALLTTWFVLTVVYYVFCIVYKFVKNKGDRYLLFIPFFLIPYYFIVIDDPYDYRIKLLYFAHAISFYVFFYLVKKLIDKRFSS